VTGKLVEVALVVKNAGATRSGDGYLVTDANLKVVSSSVSAFRKSQTLQCELETCHPWSACR